MTRSLPTCLRRVCEVLVLLSGLLLQMGCSADFSASTAQRAAVAFSPGSAPSYILVSAETPEADASRAAADAPLKLLGRGTTGRIVNFKGDALKSAEEGRPIYGLKLSPDRSLALVYFGDAEYTVYPSDNLNSGVNLPTRPPGPADATGFAWHWLDERHLLANAELPSTDTGGK